MGTSARQGLVRSQDDGAAGAGAQDSQRQLVARGLARDDVDLSRLAHVGVVDALERPPAPRLCRPEAAPSSYDITIGRLGDAVPRCSNYSGYDGALDEWRITKGVARYDAAVAPIAVPTSAFPNP